MGKGSQSTPDAATQCPNRVIRVDSRVPVDVRLASIFGQAPPHSQAVVNPLEGVRLRTLARSGPPRIMPAGKSCDKYLPFVAGNDEAKDSCKFETLREAHHLIARLTPTSRLEPLTPTLQERASLSKRRDRAYRGGRCTH